MKDVGFAVRGPKGRNGNRGRLGVQEGQEQTKISVDPALDILEAFTYQEESSHLRRIVLPTETVATG